MSAPSADLYRAQYFKMHGLPATESNLAFYDSYRAEHNGEEPESDAFRVRFFQAHGIKDTVYHADTYRSWKRISAREPPAVLFHEIHQAIPDERLVCARIHMDMGYHRRTLEQHDTMPGLVGPLTLDEYAWALKRAFLLKVYSVNEQERAAYKAKSPTAPLVRPQLEAAMAGDLAAMFHLTDAPQVVFAGGMIFERRLSPKRKSDAEEDASAKKPKAT